MRYSRRRVLPLVRSCFPRHRHWGCEKGSTSQKEGGHNSSCVVVRLPPPPFWVVFSPLVLLGGASLLVSGAVFLPRLAHTQHTTQHTNKLPSALSTTLEKQKEIFKTHDRRLFAPSVWSRSRYGKLAKLTRNVRRVIGSDYWVRTSPSQDLSCSGSCLTIRWVAWIRASWQFQ